MVWDWDYRPGDLVSPPNFILGCDPLPPWSALWKEGGESHPVLKSQSHISKMCFSLCNAMPLNPSIFYFFSACWSQIIVSQCLSSPFFDNVAWVEFYFSPLWHGRKFSAMWHLWFSAMWHLWPRQIFSAMWQQTNKSPVFPCKNHERERFFHKNCTFSLFWPEIFLKVPDFRL